MQAILILNSGFELNYNIEWQDYCMQHTVCEDEIVTIGLWLRQVLKMI